MTQRYNPYSSRLGITIGTQKTSLDLDYLDSLDLDSLDLVLLCIDSDIQNSILERPFSVGIVF